MENTQETKIIYIAGLFEGEGSVNFHFITPRTKLGNPMKQYRAYVFFTNTEYELVDVFIQICKEKEWSYYIKNDIRPGRKVCYQLVLNKQKDRLEFLKLILPHLVGLKKKLSEIVIEFLEYRVSLAKNWQLDRGGNGRYIKGVGSSYSEKDELFYQRYKSIKDSSETTRKIPHKFGVKI